MYICIYTYIHVLACSCAFACACVSVPLSHRLSLCLLIVALLMLSIFNDMSVVIVNIVTFNLFTILQVLYHKCKSLRC